MAESYKLTDTFELRGKFWLPYNPELVVTGRIERAPDKTTLVLDGDFEKPPDTIADIFKRVFAPPSIEWPCVLGLTSDGQACSLFRVLVLGQDGGSKGITSCRCHVHFLLLGQHFDDLDGVRAIRGGIRASNLGSFDFRKFAEIKQETTPEGKESLIAVYQPLDERTFRLESEKTKIIFRASTGWSFSDRSVRVGTSYSLHLIPDSPQTLEWFVETFGRLCTLMSLLADSVVAPLEMQLISEEGGGETWVLYEPRLAATGDEDRLATLFRLDDVQDRFEGVLEKWFSDNETLNESIGLVIDALFISHSSVYTRFQLLARAVEAFSRATADAHYLSKDEYEPTRQALVQAIPKDITADHRKSLEKRIEFGYQYSLAKRIKDLFESLKEPTSALVSGNRTAFVRTVVDMRNYLSHHTDELRELAVDGKKLYWIGEQLLIFLRILFFKYLGLDEDVIVEHMRRGHRTSQVIAKTKKREGEN